MTKNLYVVGIPYSTRESDLVDLFSSCGQVASAKVIMDRDTGRSKGFAFVEMATEEQARDALHKFNGYTMGSRQISVKEARMQDKRPEAGFAGPRSFGASAAPGFVERRSGSDRRAGWGPAPARGGFQRREGPGPRKWGPKPDGFGPKKWERKPGGFGPRPEKSFGEREGFGPKKWERKPGGFGPKPGGFGPKKWERKPGGFGKGRSWDKPDRGVKKHKGSGPRA